jgi:hypothetical protein
MLIALAGAVSAAPAIGMAQGDAFAAGFYTRGVDVAYFMDQGGTVVDPFYIPTKDLSLLPRVTLAVSHEDNVFLDPENEEPNTSVSLAPGLLALWGRPAGNHVYADYGLSISLYESESEVDDRPNHMLRLGTTYRSAKSQVQGQLGYRRIEKTDPVVGERVVQQNTIGDLGVEHRLTAKSSLGAVGRVERHDFELDAYIDYDRYYGGGRLYHRVSPKSEAFLQGGIGRDEPREETDAASAADFTDLSLGVRGKQTPKFTTSGRVGYMWRRYDDDRRPAIGHWTASLGTRGSPFGLTTFGADLNADVRPAIDAAGLDVVDQNLVLSATRRLFVERLRGNASVTAGRIDYFGRAAAPEEDGGGAYDGRRDHYWGFQVGVDWWTKGRWSFGGAYSYMNRSGDRGAGREVGEASSYEYGRWLFRASWNY